LRNPRRRIYFSLVHLLYLDESGGVEAPGSHRTATPAMIILGLILDATLVHGFTSEFLAFKRQHFPGKFRAGPALDHIRVEVKGAEFLQHTRSDSRDRRRYADHARVGLLKLMDRFGCQVIGRVWVKRPGEALKPAATYGYAVQDIARHFMRFLAEKDSVGVIYADSRNPRQNIEMSHSIFTQKWRTGDDPYKQLVDLPAFVHSENQAGIQAVDMLASMITLPMVAAAYGASPGTIHDSPRYAEVREKHGDALKSLQFRYFDEAGRSKGGIVVSDAVAARPSGMLFGEELQITIPAQATAAPTEIVGPPR
jgi:Protein of unknown function (DUF3800)